MENKTKLILGISILALVGITTGIVIVVKKNKKNKLVKTNSQSSPNLSSSYGSEATVEVDEKNEKVVTEQSAPKLSTNVKADMAVQNKGRG